jgi:hypothetical protein
MWLVKPTLETQTQVKVEDNDIIVTCRDCVLVLRPWKSESKVKVRPRLLPAQRKEVQAGQLQGAVPGLHPKLDRGDEGRVQAPVACYAR